MQNLLHDSFGYSHPFCYGSTWRSTIFLQNIGYASNVFTCSCHRRSSASVLITNRLPPFWKCIVPTKHCSTMYSRLTLNFLNNFKCFCGIKTGFPAKTNLCRLFNIFFLLQFITRTKETSYITSQICTSLWAVWVETWHVWRRGFIHKLRHVSWRLRC